MDSESAPLESVFNSGKIPLNIGLLCRLSYVLVICKHSLCSTPVVLLVVIRHIVFYTIYYCLLVTIILWYVHIVYSVCYVLANEVCPSAKFYLSC